MTFGKRLLALCLALVAALPLLAQQKKDKEDKDSLVMLLSAKSAQLVEERGEHFRKVFGPARFLHNGTYLICDTALWNLDRNYIKALGHVKIIQDETVLTSDKLDYLIDEDRAEFRGTLVQLTDKEGNLLRTRHLDFNTRDSVAVFQHGGAMKDKEGQIIESVDGTYDARIKLFTFLNEVNMFTDSVFVQTNELLYDGNTSFATFVTDLNAWREDDMLSAGGGWYDRPKDLFFFQRNVHGLTPTQEAWSDSLYFDRLAMTVDMYGNAQVADSTRNATGMAGHIAYRDSLSHITLTRTPLIQLVSEEDDKRDTTWVGGEKLVYYTLPMCDVDSLYKVSSAARREEILVDAVTEYRRKAAEAAAKAREETQRQKDEAEGKIRPNPKGGESPSAAPPVPPAPSIETPPADTLQRPPLDSLQRPPLDSLQRPPVDSLPPPPADTAAFAERPDDAPDEAPSVISDEAPSVISSEAPSVISSEAEGEVEKSDTLSVLPPAPVDSTRVGFLFGRRNVKIYRKDFQVLCDSLAYTDLDSLARLYQRPLIWNEPNRQFSADSIAALIRNSRLDRASLMSDAFVAIREDSLLFDQVRGTEMMAFFDSTGVLGRFDALGGSTALFYLEENETLATVNTVEAKMLSANFKEGIIDRIFYFENVKNDAYPVVQLPKESRFLKGFEWKGDLKPNGPEDISDRKVKASERKAYESFPHASFRQTDIYFPGYMAGVHKTLAENERRRELRRAERRRQQALADSLAAVAAADTLAFPSDSTLVMPSDSTLVIPSFVEGSDSIQVAPSDSALVVSSETGESLPTPAELKAAEKARKQAERERQAAEKAQKKAERIARREARWAELDRRDAEKAAAKEARRQERLRKKNERVLEKIRADQERERRVFEQYKAKYERRKAREEARKQK